MNRIEHVDVIERKAQTPKFSKWKKRSPLNA